MNKPLRTITFIIIVILTMVLLFYLSGIPVERILPNEEFTGEHETIIKLENCVKFIYEEGGEIGITVWIIILGLFLYSLIASIIPKIRIKQEIYFEIVRSIFMVFTLVWVIGGILDRFSYIGSGRSLYLNLSFMQISQTYMLGIVLMIFSTYAYCCFCCIKPKIDMLYLASVLFTVLSVIALLTLIPCILQFPRV